DRPQQAVRPCQVVSLLALQAIGGDQRLDRVEGGRDARRFCATAVDHLLYLDEKFDLADSAAATLQIEARPDVRALRKMVANPRGNLTHFLDHAEVERAAPHERLDCIEEL